DVVVGRRGVPAYDGGRENKERGGAGRDNEAEAPAVTDHQRGQIEQECEVQQGGGGGAAKGDRRQEQEFDSLREARVEGRGDRCESVRFYVTRNQRQMIGGAIGTHLRRESVDEIDEGEEGDQEDRSETSKWVRRATLARQAKAPAPPDDRQSQKGEGDKDRFIR